MPSTIVTDQVLDIQIDANALIACARSALKAAYAPYSGMKVGAALLFDDGSVYSGANVENSSYGLTMCAERSALFAAVSAGKRKIRALAITSDRRTPLPPCGACRQVLWEFSDPNTIVLLDAGESKEPIKYTLGALLPDPFSMSD
jgi:cytidine deaminase